MAMEYRGGETHSELTEEELITGMVSHAGEAIRREGSADKRKNR